MDYSKNKFFFGLIIVFCHGALAAPAKPILLQLYQDHPHTFFCEQTFSKSGVLNKHHLKQQAMVDETVAWMHLVPIKQLAPFFACYQQPCLDKHGKRHQGVRCCQKQDKQFQRMLNDLHNVVPETRTLKSLRNRYTFGEFTHEPPKKSSCHFYVDKKIKQLEPAPSKRGMIARTYLYMKDTYPLRLTDEEMALYLKWHQQYPVTAQERERNEKIFTLQGIKNHYVR